MIAESDYVVVGAGTAGCAIAARLAEDPDVSVTLVEAGGPYRSVFDVPLIGLWAWLRWPGHFCHSHWTVPQPALGGRRVWWPAGRLVGGSSAINAMIYSRGAPASYDRWRHGGEPEWDHAALLPYFKRSEDQERGPSRHHGVGGPVGVSDGRYGNDITDAFIEGCREAGIPPTSDFNGEQPEGAGIPQVTQRAGRRSSARDYLSRTSGGSRVRIHTRSRAVRVTVDRGRATGIEVWNGRSRSHLGAHREVILSAGVVGSPHLLMQSGIGPADILGRAGVPVLIDSPGVGENLQDHVRIPIIEAVIRPRPTRLSSLVKGAVDYVRARRGLLTSNVCDAAAVVRLPGHQVPSLRIICQWRALPEAQGTHVSFDVALIDPFSRGRLSLSGEDSRDIAIDPSYLADVGDLHRLMAGIDLVRRIASSAACRRAGIANEVRPGREDVGAYVRRSATTAFHPVGTCRLGAASGAVVDPYLRVMGVAGLRVVDASVMPTTVAGNAQAAVFAIAERAADLIAGRDQPA